jgi:hypothetical protein
VHLDLVFEGDAFLNQELEDVPAVVALQLNDGAPLVVLHCRSVTAPGFLERADHLLQVQVIRQTLHECQALSGRTLLEMQICHNRFSRVWVTYGQSCALSSS